MGFLGNACGYNCSIDNKHHRIFLRRTRVDIPSSALFVGASINVLSRQLNIIDYADEYTRKTLGQRQEPACIILNGDSIQRTGRLLDRLPDYKLTLMHARTVALDASLITQLSGNDGFENVYAGQSMVIELLGSQACEHASILIKDFGSEAQASLNSESALAVAQIIFQGNIPCKALMENTTLCIIKPHAIQENRAGAILEMLRSSDLEISALKTITFSHTNATEFLEVYKGVLPEYAQLVNELESGTCVAVEVVGSDAYQRLRALCGPHDPELARHVRPNTIRAKFGVDKSHNAVHCTDLKEDTFLEVEYVFELLS
eukprot:gene8402-930_t